VSVFSLDFSVSTVYFQLCYTLSNIVISIKLAFLHSHRSNPFTAGKDVTLSSTASLSGSCGLVTCWSKT